MMLHNYLFFVPLQDNSSGYGFNLLGSNNPGIY
jgi:hypothetical protein